MKEALNRIQRLHLRLISFIIFFIFKPQIYGDSTGLEQQFLTIQKAWTTRNIFYEVFMEFYIPVVVEGEVKES